MERRNDAVTHHSLTDGYHDSALSWSCFPSTRMRCVPAGGAVVAQPAPEPLEVVLEQRGIRKQSRSGVERFIPVMFAYELPRPRGHSRRKSGRPTRFLPSDAG